MYPVMYEVSDQYGFHLIGFFVARREDRCINWDKFNERFGPHMQLKMVGDVHVDRIPTYRQMRNLRMNGGLL